MASLPHRESSSIRSTLTDVDVESDAELPVSPGDVVGRYTLERVVGSGGMGLVYQASCADSGPGVAVKFLKPALSVHRKFFDRFVEEGRMTEGVDSPHVVRVLERGELSSGAPYIVMELLDGTDLEVLLTREGALGPERAVEYALQACEALSAVHRAGIVHCDVKPENLVLTRSKSKRPVVKLVDFGIAKCLAPGSGVPNEAESLGSPSYMSPEQMTPGQTIDTRADIWSLGVVLYRLLTDEMPFEGVSLVGLSRRVLHADPAPLCQHVSDVDSFLQEIVSRCLQKRREDRYRSIDEVACELQRWKAARAAASAKLSRRRPLSPSSFSVRWSRAGVRWIAALVTAAALAGVALATGASSVRRARAAAVSLVTPLLNRSSTDGTPSSNVLPEPHP